LQSSRGDGGAAAARRGLAAQLGVLAVVAMSLLSACETAPPPPKLVLTPARFSELPGWDADRHGDALVALKRSCARIATLPEAREIGPGGMAGTAASWREPCEQASRLDPADHAAARAFFEAAFAPLAAADNAAAEGLFTGYYEPELRGAPAPGGRYTVPLHGRPADLVTVDLGQFRPEWQGQRITGQLNAGSLRPYPTRAEIEAGALKNARSEIVWVEDPVDAFFLQIQGSGRVLFEDGSMMRVGYAAQNGHPYVAIGRELIARGVLTRETVSMQSIRAWLMANPGQAPSVMNLNPSYVFFRALDGDGPIGSEGVALTPGRSLAVDRAFLAMGLPVWLDAEDPLDTNVRMQRLLVAQDTGGAIRGPVRGDVFWGHGAEAAERAGRMRSRGRYWILLPRNAATRIAGAS
jgi:membrane-bound lytic murein transglycosylase A